MSGCCEQQIESCIFDVLCRLCPRETRDRTQARKGKGPTTALTTITRQTPGLMARRDDITGKGPVAGNHVSHAHNKAKRRFEINVQKKRFFIPEENRWVTLKVSAKTLKTINKKGISAVLREARAKGVSV